MTAIRSGTETKRMTVGLTCRRTARKNQAFEGRLFNHAPKLRSPPTTPDFLTLSIQRLRIAARFLEELVHELLLIVKIRALDTVEGLGEIQKPMRRAQGKNAEGSRHPESFASGDEDALPIVHKDHIGAKFDRERNGLFLSRIERFEGGVVSRGSTSIRNRNVR